ncbi:MAG: hypothetical protein WDM91_16890 [Rhizomicrobium sp.]
MAHQTAMRGLRAALRAHGIKAVAPADERNRGMATLEARRRFKRRVSRAYFRRIRRDDVVAILVANRPKRGRKNYIGPNTFAEIAIAFDARKAIYLLADVYAPFADELAAWGAIALKGDVERLADTLRKPR